MPSTSLRRRAGALAGLALGLSGLAVVAPPTGAASTAPALQRGAATHPARPVDVIVQVRGGASLRAGRAAVRRAGGHVTSRAIPIIHGFAARLPAAGMGRLSGRSAIRAVSLNGSVHTRAIPTSALTTAYPFAAQADRAWNDRSATGAGVGVAVIDTGIDGTRPDFRRSRTNADSRVVASAVTNPNATSAADGYGHGTHVAGIIAGNGWNRPADDPLAGRYVGIAPDANLVSIKVSDDAGQTSVLDVIYGLQFAVDHKADYNIRVINMSLSASVAESAKTDPLDAAAEAAWFRGIAVVAAAGNAGTAADAVSYAPANDPYVISVGAVDDHGSSTTMDDTFPSWSSRGTTQDGYAKPEVVAPGAHIVSTLAPGSAFASLCPACVTDGDYFRVGGTSMAAAVVSGAAADVIQRHPGWTPNQVKGALSNTGGPLSGSSARELRVPDSIDLVDGSKWLVSNRGLSPNTLIDTTTGGVDSTRASWRAASWRDASGSALDAGWAAASWRCDCSLLADGSVDPAAASWRAASWRRTTDFSK